MSELLIEIEYKGDILSAEVVVDGSIGEAPKNGTIHGRKDGSWTTIPTPFVPTRLSQLLNDADLITATEVSDIIAGSGSISIDIKNLADEDGIIPGILVEIGEVRDSVPTTLSDLDNDLNLDYTAGTGISIDATNRTISATPYTGGEGITVTGHSISFSGTTPSYTQGTNISISPEGVISAIDTKYSAGTNISISPEGVISSTASGGGPGIEYEAGDGITIDNENKIHAIPYTAGTGISISDNVVSVVGGGGGSGIVYQAGANIQISGDIISALDTTYTAGAGISIVGGVITATGGGGEGGVDPESIDIAILADNSGLRTQWSGKQDKITVSGTTLVIS